MTDQIFISYSKKDSDFVQKLADEQQVARNNRMPTPEEQAREIIDRELTADGWVVQDFNLLNLGAGPGVAVREFQMSSGPTDYVLFVERVAVADKIEKELD